MNLGAILKEGSVVDHSWMEEGLVAPNFDPSGHNRNNDIKPELELEFGLSDVAPLFDETNSGEVKRNIPEDALGDMGPVVIFARGMMNAGASAKTVDQAIRAKFAKVQISKEVKALLRMFKLDGVVGRFVLDGRVPGGCVAAVKQAANSPFKKFIRHVIGCQCGDPQMIHSNKVGMKMVESSGNAMDDFFNDNQKHASVLVPHCRKVGLPLLASMDDLDEEWLSDTLIDIGNIAGAEDVVKSAKVAGSPAVKAREVFRAIDRVAAEGEAKKYAGRVETSSFVVEMAENEVELSGVAMPDIEINHVNEEIQQVIPIDPYARTNFDGPKSLQKNLNEIDLCGAPSLIDQEIEQNDTGDIFVPEAKQAPGVLDVRPSQEGFLGQPVDGLFPVELDQEPIDMGLRPDDFFDGGDEFELDEQKSAEGVNVDICESEMEW
jgi:hypothetical protein